MEVVDQENRKRTLEGQNFNCEICGNIFVGNWTDFHGQATCNVCGAPYQLKDYHGASPEEKYPYITLKPDFIPIFKEYWEQTRKRCRLGTFLLLRDYPGVLEEQEDFKNWLKEKHPEWLQKKEREASSP